MDAVLIDPVCISFTNPLTNIVQRLYVQVAQDTPMWRKVGLATELILTKLGQTINDIHTDLTLIGWANNTLRQPMNDVRPEWVLPAFCRHLPTRQANGVVWQVQIPEVKHVESL